MTQHSQAPTGVEDEMDINEALAELRGAFPRVTWVPHVDAEDPDDYALFGAGVMVWRLNDGWVTGTAAPEPDPVSAVRAWLAAQPTAVFYPEAPSGEVVEVRGVVAVSKSGAYCLTGWSGALSDEVMEDATEQAEALVAPAEPVVYHPVVIRVPVPVEPPVLVGEVVS